jgi:signal transduction histidine kinase
MLRIYILLFFISFFSFSQDLDSSSQIEISGDTNTVQDFINKSKLYVDNDPVLSLKNAQDALTLSQKLNFEKGSAESYRRIGIYYLNQSEYPKALDYFLKALRIAEQIENNQLIAKCLMNLGVVYYDYEEYNLALANFNKALAIAEKIKDKQSISGILTNKANVQTDMGDYKSALENYQKAVKINAELQDKQGISIAWSNIGNIYFYQKNYKAAEDYYKKCLKLKEESNDKQGMVILLNNIGNLYINIADYNKAIEYCKKSIEMAEEIDSKDDIQRASFNLSTIYKRKKDFKTALAYYELGSILKDSIFSDAKNKELGKLESKYDLEKQEAQIKLLKKDRALKEEQNRRTLSNRNLLIAGIVLISVMIFTVFQFVNNRKFKKINQQLLVTNKEMEAKSSALAIANEELDNFVYRSSHDLKAPLTSVLGLINITKMELEDDSKILKSYLEKMQLSVDKLMLVLQDLANYSRNSRLEVSHSNIEFEKLLSKSIESLKHLDKYHSIKIEQSVEGEGLFISDPIRVGILINNLLSNAITHHDTSKKNAFISVKINYNLRKAIISVEDNGKGIEDEIKPHIFEMFYKGSNESQGSGLGLYIAQGVINKLNGHLSFKSKENMGSTFTAEIPNAKNSNS